MQDFLLSLLERDALRARGDGDGDHGEQPRLSNNYPSGEGGVLIHFMAEYREENMKERVAFFAIATAALLLSYATPALTGEAATTAPASAASNCSEFIQITNS